MQQSQELIDYVRQTYGDELEFLWKKFDDNAVWRRKDTKKWYAALLTTQKNNKNPPKLNVPEAQITISVPLIH